jgi:hypothetical protein
MTPDTDVDVVVIGFGIAGATAALSAADAGARVLALDQRVPDRRGEAGRLRAAALAAGVSLRAPHRVHELLTEGGRVCGVGYAALPPGGLAARAHRFLRWAGDRTGLASPGRAADSLWAARFVVGEVRCPAVILAIDPRHWDFVGAATWSAARVASRGEAGGTPGWLGEPVTSLAAQPTPELAARRWLARRAGDQAAAHCGELLVDGLTGAVLVTAGQVVAGLYAAVPSAARAASRAGFGAVITAPSWPPRDLSLAR